MPQHMRSGPVPERGGPSSEELKFKKCCTRYNTALPEPLVSCSAPLGQGRYFFSLRMHATPPARRPGNPTRQVSVKAGTVPWQRKTPHFCGHGGRAGTGPGLACEQRPHRLPEEASPVTSPRPRLRSRGMAPDENCEEVWLFLGRSCNSLQEWTKRSSFDLFPKVDFEGRLC